MPAVRVERLPVKVLGLGLLGFDHLQIVFLNDFNEVDDVTGQDGWFVIEGIREPSEAGTYLAVEGWHGGTTLSEANGGRVGDELVASIGVSEARGGRDIAQGGEAVTLWATLASYAADIEAQKFPYIAAALPASPLPTLNSSSLVASLLHHAGIDIGRALPSGLRFSPGMATLLGTSHDDTLQTADGFTALVAGDGNDDLSGGDNAIEKLYGGRGNDTLRWSSGVNILHGGQPGLAYAQDGVDTADYTGASAVRIDAPPAGEAHRQPDYVVTHSSGQDQLFSIEEIIWDGANDRLFIGRGVGLAAGSLKVELRDGAAGRGGILDLSQTDAGFEIMLDRDATLNLARRATPGDVGGLAVSGAVRIVGSPHADRFILSTPGQSIEIEDAAADDRLILGWMPARAEISPSPQQPQDLIIRIFPLAGGGEGTEIQLHNFRDGALGLDLNRSELAFAPDDVGSMLISPASSVLSDALARDFRDIAFEPEAPAFASFGDDLAFFDDLDDTFLHNFAGAAMLMLSEPPASG
jgi:hypothetical protein